MARKPHETDIWVGARARLRRLEMGMSQTVVAERLGITFQQIQKYEKGMNRIGASRLQALAQVLDVPISYFFPDPVSDAIGSAENPNEVLDLLRTPGAVELLRVFSRITNPVVRRAARTLLESLADSHEQSGDTAPSVPLRPN